jgi:hypothetical protein
LEGIVIGIKEAYKRKDGTYVVDGYHVCPKEIDPIGKYDIAEVSAYLAEHPEALIPEPKPPEPSAEEKKARKDIDDEAKELELDKQWIRDQRKKAGK